MSEEITAQHQQRIAAIYIRQSSPGQVLNNRESYRLQKKLTTRAIELGWQETRINIIEGDQGQSASTPNTREDFNALLQLIQDQQVGIVFGIDVSRLSRNSIDWTWLTHWCGMHDTLLGDAQQIYNPALPQDRLVLGIQGVLAVHELDMIRSRMQAGLNEKATRGQLHHGVPRGYVVVEGKELRKHPNAAVQDAITRMFEKFSACSSVSQLVTWLWDQDIKLPRPAPSGDGTKFEWADANYRSVLDMLKNPKYAGIYVYPRHVRETKTQPCGKVQKRWRLANAEEWTTVLHDHHPAYITPQQYQANQEKIAMNAQRSTASRGATNRGVSLLAGLIECRRCSHKMQVHYSSTGRVSYNCSNGRRQRDRGSTSCFRFSADELERQLSEQILHVVSPAGLAAAELAASRLSDERDARRGQLLNQLEQARYEADLTRRRLDSVDPANRLVFSTLTSEWELGLQAVQDAEHNLQTFDLEDPPRPTAEEREQLNTLGSRLETLWYGESSNGRLKQQVVRLLVDHVLADLDEERDEVVLWVKWSGGHHTELRSARRRRPRRKWDLASLLDTLRKILDDASISRSLNRHGVPSEERSAWTAKSVAATRKRLGITHFDAKLKESQGWLTQQEAAIYLGISPMSVSRLISTKVLTAEGIGGLPQVICQADLESKAIQDAVRRIKSHGNAPLPTNPNQKTLIF